MGTDHARGSRSQSATAQADRAGLQLVPRGPRGAAPRVRDRWDGAAPAAPRDQLAHRAHMLAGDPSVAHGRCGSISTKPVPAGVARRELLWAAGSRHDLATLTEREIASAPLLGVGAGWRGDSRPARVAVPHALEALLHAGVPGTHVDHTHPDGIAALCCSADAEQLVRACFAGEATWVDGLGGTAEWAQAIGRAARRPGMRFVLAAHDGLIAWGATSESCYGATIEAADRAAEFVAERTLGSRFGGQAISALSEERRTFLLASLLPMLRRALALDGRSAALRVDASPRVRELLCSRDGAMLARAGAASASHVAHTGHVPLWIDADPWYDSVADLVQRAARAVAHRHVDAGTDGCDRSARVILIAGAAMITSGATDAEAELTRTVYRRAIEATAGASSIGCFAPLAPA